MDQYDSTFSVGTGIVISADAAVGCDVSKIGPGEMVKKPKTELPQDCECDYRAKYKKPDK